MDHSDPSSGIEVLSPEDALERVTGKLARRTLEKWIGSRIL